MRVIRLKRGVRVHMTDTEYEALRFAADHGTSNLEGCLEDYSGSISPAAMRLLETNSFAMDPLGVTEDRRKADKETDA